MSEKIVVDILPCVDCLCLYCRDCPYEESKEQPK